MLVIYFFILINIVKILSGSETYQCVSYGQCHVSETGLYQNCVYKGPAKPLAKNSTALNILKKRCPHLVTSDPIELCCDVEQIITLENNMRTAEVVYKRCTSCLRNLGRQICDSTCAANQSAFMTISSSELDTATFKRYITGLIIYLSTDYMYGTYESCSGVVMPSTGRLVLDAACGIYDAAHCSPERWFGFMGDMSLNPYTPYNIKYVAKNEPFLNQIPYNATTIPCNVAYDNDSVPCSCVDCELSCPSDYGQNMSEPEPFTFFGISWYIIICFVVYLLGIILWIIHRIMLSRSKKRRENYENSPYYDEVPVSYLDQFGDRMDTALTNFFTKWGTVIGNHAILVLSISSWIILAMCHGVMYLTITSDPIELWASPESQSRIEKDYFDSRFQPFYRTEQVCIRAVGLPKIQHNTSNGIIEFGPAFNKEFLLEVYKLQEQIQQLPGLKEICFAPLSITSTGDASNLDECVVQSVWGYFQNNLQKFNKTIIDSNGFNRTYLDHLNVCLLNSYSPDCMAPYGGNIEPALAFGRLSGNETDYRTASAIFLTFIINNHVGDEDLAPAQNWEEEFLKLITNWTETMKPEFMDVSYRAERSIEDELERESKAEVWTVIISYLLMFLYITIGLGSYRSWSYILVDSKITIGIFGVILVLLSVLSALGICSYMGISTSLLVIEVIPFLVLAVGVDNIFIIVQAEQRLKWRSRETPEEHIGRTLGEVGPSILLSSFSEAACFSIGTLTQVPVVQTFAIYSTIAILVNFLLQVTLFIALMVLDSKRRRSKRLDVLCCVKLKNIRGSGEYNRQQWLRAIFRKYYGLLTDHYIIRGGIVLLFWTMACISLAGLPHIEVGLEQELSMPEDSYMVKYFEFLKEDFTMGPPVYFVLKNGLNLSDNETQNLICGGLYCDSDSLGTQIYLASRYPNVTYIARPASSWVDDYLDWSTVSGCCKYYEKNNTFCPHNVDSDECKECNITINKYGRPDEHSFQKYLPYFLMDNPDVSCAKGGHAAYNGGVNYLFNTKGGADNEDSYFMAYHSALKTSEDYYKALRSAREIAANISNSIQSKLEEGSAPIEVFAYSLFYVYYEQYLMIWHNSVASIGLSILAVFLVSCLLTGFDVISSLIIIGTVLMIVVNLANLMYWWDISLNAISLLNLVVSIGISVEFCSHIVQAFNSSSASTKHQRAVDALSTIGTSVFSGITLTKIIGVAVLGFAKTRIFRIFYFRMYFGMILYGALHSLIFLPTLLTFIGPDNTGRRHLKIQRNSFTPTTTL